MDRFEAMATFLRVVDAKSLSQAARSIPMSLTAVSRQIVALEAQLGTQLLRRTTRRLALTEDGRLFYDRAKAILGEVRELEQALSSGRSEPAGRLRVSAPVLLGRSLLAPLLPDFLARYPSVTVDLLLVDRAVNLVDENLDVAIRVGALPDSQLITRRLSEVHMVVCAAPAYLARRGVPQAPSDLLQHDCLVFNDLPGSVDWRFLSAAGRDNVRVIGRLWANSLDVVVAAARDGVGIVRAPSWQVAADLSAGRLIRILADFERPATPVHLLFQPARLAAPKIRLFVDYLVERWNGQRGQMPAQPPQRAGEMAAEASFRNRK